MQETLATMITSRRLTRRGGRQPQAVDLLVDRGVLLDVDVALRDVGLGLVVVVVADEIVDGVVREELLELAVELGGQGLVVRHDQRGPLLGLDDVGHGERLARAGHAHEHLVLRCRAEPVDEGVDGLRLIAGGLEGGDELEHFSILPVSRLVDYAGGMR